MKLEQIRTPCKCIFELPLLHADFLLDGACASVVLSLPGMVFGDSHPRVLNVIKFLHYMHIFPVVYVETILILVIVIYTSHNAILSSIFRPDDGKFSPS